MKTGKKSGVYIAKSDIKSKVNTEELALFIACSNSQEEISAQGLENVVHKRKHRVGARPGMKCTAVTGGQKAMAEIDSWLPPRRKSGHRQVRKML